MDYIPAPAAETISVFFPNACSEIFLVMPGWDIDMIILVGEFWSAWNTAGKYEELSHLIGSEAVPNIM